MGYELFLGKDLQLPITPSKIEIKMKNSNQTYDLMCGGQLNILKTAGLSEISFTAELPQVPYPYATYPNGFQDAEYYLDKIEQLKLNLEPFEFIVTRTMPDGRVLFDTNMLVSLESYTINEEASNGFDIKVSINLKQYRQIETQKIEIKKKEDGTVEVEKIKKRQTVSAPNKERYAVEKGDSLWNIAKKQLGDGTRWKEIYALNKDTIGDSPSLIYPRQVLKLPQ